MQCNQKRKVKFVDYLKQLGIILAICVLGEVISVLIGGVLPSNVLGMILLLILLASKLIKARNVENAADFFLKNMAIFFLPVSLGILELYSQVKSQLLAIIAVCIITTFLTAVATAATVHFILVLQKNKKEENKNV